MLMGKLEPLPWFEVKGIPCYFIANERGQFDRQAFIADLKEVVEGSADGIGAIPYQPCQWSKWGRIEHSNSTALRFSGTQLSRRLGRNRVNNFLAHAYFHQYPVKRIRPIEWGPFKYNQETQTRMRWVWEGFPVYYR